MELKKALLKDATTLLVIQQQAFEVYASKYGDFDSNPYHMTLARMKFNIRYRLGRYDKIVVNNEIIGGIFAFDLDEPFTKKIAQFYLLPPYQSGGIGTEVINQFIDSEPQIKKWYIDTILQEDYNVSFYLKNGFIIIDEEEEHEGLTFVTMVKKIE